MPVMCDQGDTGTNRVMGLVYAQDAYGAKQQASRNVTVLSGTSYPSTVLSLLDTARLNNDSYGVRIHILPGEALRGTGSSS
jgi:uncharacterized protein with beta-barrel porin domain